VREAVGLELLEAVVMMAGGVTAGRGAAMLAAGAVLVAAVVAIVLLSVSFDEESSGVTALRPYGNRTCAGGLQRPRW